ncbi:MAG TPA: glycosyl hydrolase [Vicinamibacteria bacterium]|nr:glycosyl hydrolase [Vicinamibacteria bacterium]
MIRRWASVVLAISAALAPVAHAAEEANKRKGPKQLAGLSYRLVGPPAGGRVSRVAGIPGDPFTYYAATASGGVWKSVDGGIRWKSVFDDQPVSSIGSIAVAPSDPNVVYVGSGEANIRGNLAQGNGIYKSTDAGQTWQHVWKQDGQIGTLAVHPRNADVAYAAVLGKPFGPNPERGVYRTRDGGKTWERVLFKDPDTGASDVALDPQNPRIVYAGFWQARRRPWELVSGGPGSGLYVSRDGGDSWKALRGKGLPEGIWGKVGVAVAASEPRRVYALVEADKGGLYRSDDGGETWTLASAHRALRQRAWYYTTLSVDPLNADVVWFPQVPMLKSLDGGRTIKSIEGLHHGDVHDLWIDPKKPRRMIAASDGGVDVSVDGGATWHAAALPISQLYHVSADSSVPYRVMGAMQDLGTASGPSHSLSSAGITAGHWYTVGGGEAGHVVADPKDPAVVYAGEYLGIFTRYDRRTGQARNVTAWPDNPSGHGASFPRYRFQWTAPIAVSPHDPKTVYHGANVLFRTQDGGQSWTALSGDLTRDDETRQRWSGGPITGDNTGAEYYGTIFAIAESPREPGLIWVGSDDGLVHVTRDAGRTWTNVTANVPGFPEWGTVSLIEPSPFDAAVAYLVVDNHRMDDTRPQLWKTADHGKTWKSLAAGLAKDVYLHAVREDPKAKGFLYAGTERGVVFSPDDGVSWKELKLNLPTVAVHDLVVKDDDLVVGTHGRSIWILDDLSPLREWSTSIEASPLHLFRARPAVRWQLEPAVSSHVKGPGENPPAGATFYYWLKDEPAGDVALEVLDEKGALVRALSSRKVPPAVPEDDPDAEGPAPKPLPKEAGLQRAVWDLRYEGATKIKGAKIDSGDPGTGPLALPGRYTLRLKLGGESRETPLEVRLDPRVGIARGDLEEQLAFALALRDDLTRLASTVHDLRAVREQVGTRGALVRGKAGAEPLVAAADALAAKCDAIEARLHNPKAEIAYDILAMPGGAQLYSRLGPLYSWASEGDGRPTQGMREMYAELRRELDGLVAEWGRVVAADLPALNQKARELAPDFVTPPPPGK